MTIEEDNKKFCGYCKKCGGKCCRGDKDSVIPLSVKESKILSSMNKVKIELGKYGEGKMHFFRMNGDCPFLSKSGCVLAENKPINCKMFPLIFLYENNKIKFYFDDSDHCPYTKEIQNLKDWKKRILDGTTREVENWTKDEKLFFTALCESIEKLKKI